MKKKFDYRPVRAKVQELIRRIQNHLQSKTEQLFPLEIIVNELCIHKGADINQMTQQSGNPDKDAQCNNHDVLKADYMFSAIASCLAGDSGLWKDFNETARQAFRAQAFPDHFIKGYFEQLQHTITRARSNRGGQQQVRQASPAAMRGQVQGQMVRGHPGQQFIQRFPGQGGQTIISPHGMMVQDGGRPPGIPRHTEPFQRRTPQGNVSRFNFKIKIRN